MIESMNPESNDLVGALVCGRLIGRPLASARGDTRKRLGVTGPITRLARIVELDDQVEACRRVFASDTRWTVVRGSDLEEGESQGLPVWSRHVGDPILKSNITRRVDFALFMVAALKNDGLVHEAPRLSAARCPRRSRPQHHECGRSRRTSQDPSIRSLPADYLDGVQAWDDVEKPLSPRSRAASSVPRPERGSRLYSADRTVRSAR